MEGGGGGWEGDLGQVAAFAQALRGRVGLTVKKGTRTETPTATQDVHRLSLKYSFHLA